MLRKDIENYMTQNKMSQIDLIFNENDALAVYCTLSSGVLMDYNRKRIDRKKNIWGYRKWANGIAERIAWDK